MSSSLYLIGYAIVITGLALGAYYLHIPTRWIVVVIILLVGSGVIGVAKRRQ